MGWWYTRDVVAAVVGWWAHSTMQSLLGGDLRPSSPTRTTCCEAGAIRADRSIAYVLTAQSSPALPFSAARWNQSTIAIFPPLQHYLANDQKLKKFVPIIQNSLVYPVIYDANRTVLRWVAKQTLLSAACHV